MLQNSLHRLLEGMATTLHERVLPALDDPAVAAQVRAMVELLGNLSTRTTWDPAQLVDLRDRVRAVLEQVGDRDDALDDLGIARDAPRADPLDVEGLRAEVVADLEALADVQTWLAGTGDLPGLRRAVDEVVDWQLEQELARLVSARFGRP